MLSKSSIKTPSKKTEPNKKYLSIFIPQLLSEIKIHKTLHHRYIVEFDSVFEDSKFVYIILELCKNKVLCLSYQDHERDGKKT